MQLNNRSPLGKDHLADQRKQRRIDKVEKNLAETGIQDGEALAQDKERWN